jgi:serine/threonine protein kinase/tetratricopeptide (TPR) repeat protein
MRFHQGDSFGHYTLLAALGRGGMGEVYRARDTRLARDVAIKFVTPTASASTATLSLAEARAASALSHPHVCTLFAVEEAAGETFIVMELVEGRLLSDLIGSTGLPSETLVRYASQIAAAVAHAHERHIVHRDLKGANVIIGDSGAKVLDFGIARRYDDAAVQHTTTAADPLAGIGGGIAGTLPYMAPEVLRGEPASARSDVWALGVLFFEMATGHRPFVGATGAELTSAILRDAPPPLPAGAPSALRVIVRRCLEKEPGQRYANAGEVAAALETSAFDAAAPSRTRPRWRSISLAVAALLAILATLVWWRPFATSTQRSTIKSLAILPLSDLSRPVADDAFADGITDALIGEVGQLSPLRTISRTSVMRYRGSQKSIPEIARELGVDAVLEGSLLRSGSRLRITAQLVEAKSALSLWTRVYERDVGDLIALQRDLARTVATELRVQLTPSQQTRLTTEHRVAPAAVEAYLRGRYQWAKRTPESLTASIVSFEEAVRHDGNYASAYVGLANSYVLLSGLQIAAGPSRDSLPRAREAAARALALDPDLPEAHAALAYTLLYQWDVEGSVKAFERSIALNPNDANTRFWHAAQLAAAGRFDESIAEASRGRQLDPVSPIITAGVSWMNHFARKHEQAAAMAVATMAIDPDFVIAHARRGVALKHLADYAPAATEIGRCLTLSPDNPDHLAQLGQIHALQGQRDAAHKLIARLKQLAATRFVPAYDLALVHAALGERDAAFEWLQRAYDERYGPLVFLRVDPDLDGVRADPRFNTLVYQIFTRSAGAR